MYIRSICRRRWGHPRLLQYHIKMHFKNTLLTAALSAGAVADFIVITEYPQALQTLSPEQVR